MKKYRISKLKSLRMIFFVMFIFSFITTLTAFASSNPFKLIEASITNRSAGVTGDIKHYDNGEIDGDIVYHHLNDSVTYKLVFKNTSNKELTILSISDNNTNKNVVYDYDKYENKKINADETIELIVKTTYTNEETNISNRNQSSSVKFSINYLGEEKENINPKTFDNIKRNTILLIVSATGLITTIILIKKRNNKKISKVATMLLIGVVSIPFIAKAAILTFNITLKTDFKFYDKQVVSYIVNGKEEQIVLPYGEVINNLENPTKKGYTFVKWTYEDGTDFDASKQIKEDTKIIPVFNIDTYSISYDLNGGMTAISNPSNYTVEDKITLNNPIKPYYDFIGWSGTDLDELTKTVNINNEIGNRTYTANYKPTDYTISYSGLTDNEINNLNNKTSYNIETSEFTLTNPSDREDEDGDVTQTFAGWKSGETISNTITLPNTSDMGNKTFEAVWVNVEPTVYTITYELNDGILSESNPTSFTKKTETFTLNNPSKTGYTFKGWSGTDLDGEENLIVSVQKGTKKDLSFEANYTANTYTVKFDKNGGEGSIDDQTFTYDIKQKLSANTFTKLGYTFAGWNTLANGTGTAYSNQEEVKNILTDGEITLYAQWTPNNYEIQFIGNHSDVTGSMSNLNMVYDTAASLPIVGYSVDNYSFNGWNTESNGSGTSYENGAQVNNLATNGVFKLYAQWKINTINVSFETDGGTDVDPLEITVGDSITTLPITTKENYIFKGWYENLSDDQPIETPYTPAGNVTLHAKWDMVLCKKATVLNTETCNQTDGTKFCSGAGHNNGDTITYGNVVSSDNYTAGDAFDCNVDGTGYNQRFYYIRTLNNRAALISNKNFTAASDQADQNISFIYSAAHDQLPTSSKWSNLEARFNGKPARLITLEDILILTGASSPSYLSATGSMNDYEFLFENSNYSGIGERSTQWLEEVSSTSRYRYRNDQRNLAAVESGKENTSKNPVRPVIEVPLNLIDDSYIIELDSNGGTILNKYITVKRGSKIGTLPTSTRDNSVFGGWYNGTTLVTENTIPTGYLTLKAKWILPVDQADLDTTTYNLTIGQSTNIVINNIDELEPFTFESVDPSIASVDSDGIITALSNGTTTIKLKGTNSNKIVNITVTVQEEISKYTVSFDAMGGVEVPSIEVDKNTAIGELPTTTKSDYVLEGWYTNTSFTTKVLPTTIIKSNKTLYAKWVPENAVAEVNGEYYSDLQVAVNGATVPKTTVKLIKDVTISSYIDLSNTANSGKDIILDLNNHSLTNDTTQVIKSKATLEIKNGKIYCGASNGAIDVEQEGYVTLNNVRVEHTAVGSNGRAAIYNNGGTVVINGDSYLTAEADGSTSAKRATVQNVKGNLYINGGTIVSTRVTNSYAVTITAGTAVIGTKDDIYNKDSIKIQANTNGIYAGVDYSLYDGTVKGAVAAVNNESKITGVEENSTKVNETIDSYKVLYYELENTKYKITFDPDGGEVNPTFKTIDIGSKVGELPVPTKGIYTFDGWYYGDTLVDENTIPEDNITIKARYHYDASDEIVNFSITNGVMTEYYNRIDTWKQDQSTFQANMDENFNNYNCKCAENTCSTSGTELCDKPRGYNTGVTNISVYESDETTKSKGDLASYLTVNNGVIINMIPGVTYLWESNDDSNIYGYVKATGKRRTLDTLGTRNVRDLGGLKVDTNHDGITDGTLKYGKIFRGERLYSDNNNALAIKKLGVTEEIDLRATSEIPSNEAKLESYKHREIKHYQLDFTTQRDYYDLTRAEVVEAMQDVIDGNNIYFHCRIGTDRTGTLAYILEGLLGVEQEDMLEDYELSYFYGLVNRHRYYAEDPKSSVSKTQKFVYMYNLMPNSQGVYEWFMKGTTNKAADDLLIAQFKQAMIKYN